MGMNRREFVKAGVLVGAGAAGAVTTVVSGRTSADT